MDRWTGLDNAADFGVGLEPSEPGGASSEVGTFAERDAAGAYQRLEEAAYITRTWGDCYGYLMVSSGRADIMVDPIMSLWDLAALVPVIRGAGGVITTWEGDDPMRGNSTVASIPSLHGQVIEILNGEA